jgi:hypothetical protein
MRRFFVIRPGSSRARVPNGGIESAENHRRISGAERAGESRQHRPDGSPTSASRWPTTFVQSDRARLPRAARRKTRVPQRSAEDRHGLRQEKLLTGREGS